MLKSLHIQRFRGIREGTIEGLTQVNLLVGRNNSGKSTVLETLLLLQAGLGQQDLLARNPLGRLQGRRAGRVLQELWFRGRTDLGITVRAGFAVAEAESQVSVTLEWEQAFGVHPRTVAMDGGAELSRARAWAERSALIDPAYLRGPVAEEVFERLMREGRKDKDLVRHLNEIYGLRAEYLTQMPFLGYNRLVLALPETAVAVDWLGDGVRHAVAILAVAALAQEGALFIEELEAHQHPEALEKGLRALFGLAKENRTQLLLSTHSLELIHFALEAAEAHGLDLRIFHLDLSPDGELFVRALSAPDARLLTEMGTDPRKFTPYAMFQKWHTTSASS